MDEPRSPLQPHLASDNDEPSAQPQDSGRNLDNARSRPVTARVLSSGTSASGPRARKGIAQDGAPTGSPSQTKLAIVPKMQSATTAPDLKRFADQLTAIAEQLRSGDFSAIENALPAIGLNNAASPPSARSSSTTTAKPPKPATNKGTSPQTQTAYCPAVSCTDSVKNDASDQGGLQSLPCAAVLGSGLKINAPRDHTPADPRQKRREYAEYARHTYAIRRKRSGIFGNHELFGEPAWDILLDLYIAHVEKKPVSVSSACIGSASPPTTGLRWLGVLAEHKLVLREHDPDDQRRVLVRLTEAGLEAMDEYFASAIVPDDRRAASA